MDRIESIHNGSLRGMRVPRSVTRSLARHRGGVLHCLASLLAVLMWPTSVAAEEKLVDGLHLAGRPG